MQPLQVETERYAKCIQISKKVRWDIDKDVIRGREGLRPVGRESKAHPAFGIIASPDAEG